jgi:hypothetical protein
MKSIIKVNNLYVLKNNRYHSIWYDFYQECIWHDKIKKKLFTGKHHYYYCRDGGCYFFNGKRIYI